MILSSWNLVWNSPSSALPLSIFHKDHFSTKRATLNCSWRSMKAPHLTGKAGQQVSQNTSKRKRQPEVPDPSNPEHLAWIKTGQKIFGVLLWLSTRARPDLACAVSLVSQVLFEGLSSLGSRPRHLTQYLRTTETGGLMYLYPQGSSSKASLTEFIAYSDSSFALRQPSNDGHA